jgi:hypothetical protein
MGSEGNAVMALTIQKITQQSLQILEEKLGHLYKTKYTMRFVHGKYTIYRSEYRPEWGERRSVTLAHGLSKATATGMMKLLEDKND